MRPLISRCKVTKSKFGTVGICPNLSEFVSFCRFSEQCFFTVQSYEKEIWHCHLLSPFVTICHLSANCFFTMQSYGKEIWHCPHMSAYVRICPEMSAFVRISFSLQSYEKKNWHCPAMSSYVHLCPFMSSYGIASSHNLRCKVTKSKFGNVQICPIMSKFVHFLDIVWIWREFEDV